MQIINEGDINALAVKQLIADSGLTHRKFWANVCVSHTRGWSYETERTQMPPEVKRLVYLQYVVGLPTDITSAEIKELAAIASPDRRAKRKQKLAADFITQADALLKQAKAALNAQ